MHAPRSGRRVFRLRRNKLGTVGHDRRERIFCCQASQLRHHGGWVGWVFTTVLSVVASCHQPRFRHRLGIAKQTCLCDENRCPCRVRLRFNIPCRYWVFEVAAGTYLGRGVDARDGRLVVLGRQRSSRGAGVISACLSISRQRQKHPRYPPDSGRRSPRRMTRPQESDGSGRMRARR